MIDTVRLLIPKREMVFLEGVSSWELYSKTKQYSKFVRNPSKIEKETGKYFPRLTGYKRRYSMEENVLIEFSVPKLIYLNNLDELKDKNFEEVTDVLRDRLRDMGVILTKDVIRNASVSAVHFSKNILLEDGYTSNYIISELGKIDMRKSFDFAKTRFINDGQSLYAHTSSHEFVVYDKIADLKKTKKRSMDKDQTLYQQSLFSSITKENRPSEIIRIEVRLNQKQKMNKVLGSLGYVKNPVFREVFDSQMSQKVVTSYWRKMVLERNSGLFSINPSIKDTLQIMFFTDKKLKPKKAIYLLGLYLLAKDENGTRQLRSIVEKRIHERSWYRISKELRYATDLITKNNLRDWVRQVNKSLEKFEAYRVNET